MGLMKKIHFEFGFDCEDIKTTRVRVNVHLLLFIYFFTAIFITVGNRRIIIH